MTSLSMSSDKFRSLGLRLLEDCTSYLADLDQMSVSPALPEDHPDCLDFSKDPLPEKGIGDASFDDLKNLIRQSANLNGRYMALVLGTPLPLGALADLAASVTNQIVTGATLTSPHVAGIERTVVGWLAKAIGCPGYSGLLTSGGSMSNLLALVIGREAMHSVNEDGLDRNDLVVYTSKEIHMSIPKAMALTGLGRKNLRLLDVDDDYRLRAATVAEAIAEDRRRGLTPLAIVASSGSLKTGAIDELEQLAELAQKEGLWFHVDGAFGGLAAMARPDLFHGLNRADSITLDPHKWLHMPLDCGCLLVRDKSDSYRAFANQDYYVGPMKWSNRLLHRKVHDLFYEESIELSRRFRALKIWLTFRYFGVEAFRKSIDDNIRQARKLADVIDDHPDLELMAPVVLSAVCFRMVKVRGRKIPEEEVDDFNKSLMEWVHYRGRVYLNPTFVKGRASLRACIVNHRTTDDDLETVIQEVLLAAQEIKIYH